jgi:hypothetical protein
MTNADGFSRSFPIAYRCVDGPRDGTTENLWPGDIKNGSITFLESSLHSAMLQFSEYEQTAERTLTFVRMVNWTDNG